MGGHSRSAGWARDLMGWMVLLSKTMRCRSWSYLRSLGVLCVLIGLAGCAATGEDAPYVDRPVEQLYNNAQNSLSENKFIEASRLFDEVDRQHPYSPWAVRSQLMSAYALYEAQKYDQAIIGLNRFIQLHPGNERIDYAYYLRSLSYYEQIKDPQRDQKMTEQASAALTEVVQRFPDTAYGRDAKLKLDLARDHLAGKEMDVGRFYLRRGEYQAAINRFRRVVEYYQTTNQVPEALHRLAESYLALGLTQEARTTAAVLGHNFPGSEWYTDTYRLLTSDGSVMPQDEQSWLARLWNGSFF